MNSKRSKAIKIALIILCIVLISSCLEIFVFNYHQLKYGNTIELDSQMMLPNSTGIKKVGDVLVPTQEGASISYSFTNQYYSKLIIEYESNNNGLLEINLGGMDSSGNEKTTSIGDTYNHQLSRSVTIIGLHINSINIVFPTQAITIKNIYLVNAFDFNIFRYLFLNVTGMLLAFIIFSKKIIKERVELAFLIISLSIGSLMIILIPLNNPVTWDDDIHFQRIYEQSFGSVVDWTQAAYDYGHRLVPVANTIEEKIDVINILNSENDYGNPVVSVEQSRYIPYNYRCYLPQSSMLALARILKLSFNSTQSLARVGGLLFYTLIVYAAIRMAKFGKRIIAAIALMPTPLFMASNFSYDPYLISLAILAITVFTVEYFDIDNKINLKNMAIFLTSIILAGSTKAIYIPLILIVLILPPEKFRSPKSMYLFRFGILAIFLTIMATFVLPTVIDPSLTGDLRGGDTSVSRQLIFILNDPLLFIRLLLKSIWESLGTYFLGNMTYLNFNSLGISANNSIYITIFVILFSVFTDAVKDDKYTFKPFVKIYTLTLILVVMFLVWTALYIGFSPVGADCIYGVQGRYYLPLVVPLLFVLRSTKIETKISPIILNRIVLGTCTFITLYLIYDFILNPFNL